MAAAFVSAIVGVLVALITMIGILYPTITTTVSDQNLTGTDATIGDFLGTLVLLGAVVVLVNNVF